MKKIIQFSIVVILLFLFLSSGNAYALPEERNPKIGGIKDEATFNLINLNNIPRGWTVEVKAPYSLETPEPINKVRLHYYDKNNDYVLGIEEEAADELTKEAIIVDTKTTQKQQVEKIYKPLCTKEKEVKVNENNSCFEPFANTSKGGVLWWIEDGTFIEMDSSHMSKEDMLRMAQSAR